MSEPISRPESPIRGGEAGTAPAPPAAALSTWMPSAPDPNRTTPFAPAAPFVPACPSVPGYEILGELGRGGMGVVFKARQVKLKRLVALKMIRDGACAGAAERERFRSEAQAVARLQHPNIVQVFEVGEHQGQPFLALELVEGTTLQQRLAGTPWPPRQAALLLECLAQAVEAAHQERVIHRDLKPANVLLPAGKFVPKITDFGLAKRLDDDSGQTRTGQIMGTPSYMAPEQAAGRTREVGPATDVYALGAILYETLTGRPPFQGAAVLDTLEMVRTTDPVPPRRLNPKVPRDLETICLKCLRKEPAGRYATARDLAEDLRRFLDGEPIRGRPVGAAERAWRWCRRRPVAATLASFAVLTLLVLAIYWGTRPAYLDLRVTPGDAEATLDGEPIPLADGHVLVTRAPGRHELQVRAAGYLGHEQPVVLVRGRDNAVLADVKLESAAGYLRVDLDSELQREGAAAVAVLDEKGEEVAGGATPFHSRKLPSGRYRLVATRDLYRPYTAEVVVPTGERTQVHGPVRMEPEEDDTASIRLLKTMLWISGPWKGPKVFDDPKTTLVEFLDAVSKSHDLAFDVNEKAFQAEGVQDVLKLEIASGAPLRVDVEGERTTLSKVLRLVLNRVAIPSGLTMIPRTTQKGQRMLEITTVQFEQAEHIRMLHPVRDLMEGEGRLTEEKLVDYVTKHVPPRERSGNGVTYIPAGHVIVVVQPWSVQEKVNDALAALRQARRVDRPPSPPQR